MAVGYDFTLSKEELQHRLRPGRWRRQLEYYRRQPSNYNNPLAGAILQEIKLELSQGISWQRARELQRQNGAEVDQ